MSGPLPLNAGESVPSGASMLTLVDGTTFCLSASSGDLDPEGSPSGLFLRDARVISRWQLSLDGHSAQPLSALAVDASAARFILRRAPVAGRADSTVLVIRERTVINGMREQITLRNLSPEPAAISVGLTIDADFADLFAVKAGRTSGAAGAHSAADGTDLLLTSAADATRAVRITATAPPTLVPGGLSWQIIIPARGHWTTEVAVRPETASTTVEDLHPHREGVATVATAPWRDTNTEITVDDPVTAAVLHRTDHDLDALLITDPSDEGLTYVAAGAPWFMTLFGRDSLLTAWMTLPLDARLAMGTLKTLARLQGTKDEPLTEEEPGRILHELRLGPDNVHALGGSHYYGTVDATPLFVMLLGECWRWGADPADIRALLPAADAALAWLWRHGDRDGDGFVEYRRATDRGLINQGWKDSFDGVNDIDGRLVEAPVALCEVQGYAYAALTARAELADAFDDPATAAQCRARAEDLRTRFAERFWQADLGWLAVALDGQKRPMRALTSNIGHCLWSGIVTDEHAAIVIEHLASPAMDTGYGLRTLSEAMGAYNPMSYHNGSVWPHDTAICVAGLMRYAHLPGAVELAHRLADGLLDAAHAFGYRLPELFCGFPRTEFTPPVPYPTSCSPQAWASAAPLLLVRSLCGLDPDVPARRLRVSPRLPARWGHVTFDGLRLGKLNLRITATADGVTITGLPSDWTQVP